MREKEERERERERETKRERERERERERGGSHQGGKWKREKGERSETESALPGYSKLLYYGNIHEYSMILHTNMKQTGDIGHCDQHD